ncbi:hypothetical protein VHEMI04181 [[Torrubiella] hemipterigena]|uniref:Uncharacterized protein n=1 Tax=[Torrubiella] hemipterigena TaxID=1531966 RepID=A0A0A1TDJ6_9HYPO|nr:hypothetical protein VHEMI04181 [[Torrubiella] hemipterigena]
MLSPILKCLLHRCTTMVNILYTLAAFIGSAAATTQYFDKKEDFPKFIKNAIGKTNYTDTCGTNYATEIVVYNLCTYPLYLYRQDSYVEYIKMLSPNTTYSQAITVDARSPLVSFAASKERGAYSRNGTTKMGTYRYESSQRHIALHAQIYHILGEDEEDDESIMIGYGAALCSSGGGQGWLAIDDQVQGEVNCSTPDGGYITEASSGIHYAFCAKDEDYHLQDGELMAGNRVLKWNM